MRHRQSILLLLFDALAIASADVAALYVRFEWQLPDKYLMDVLALLPLVIPMRLLIYNQFGFYNRMWRYASVDELWAILKGVSLGTIGVVVLIYMRQFPGFPRSIVLLGWVFNIALSGGVRFLLRAWHEPRSNGKSSAGILKRRPIGPVLREDGAVRCLIVGAGDAGSLIARELLKHPEIRYTPVGFVDDAPNKQGYRIHGLSVLGTRAQIPDLVGRYKVEHVIIVMPTAPGRVVRELVNQCVPLGVKVRTLPGIYELINGKVSVNQIRDVQIEDLLGRQEIKVDLDEIAGYLSGETVLVTGAGGSIGSELCRQIARFNPKQLLLFGHGENSIYEIHLELVETFPGLATVPIVGDVQDASRVNAVFAEYTPGVVFHAAAHKHVPLMEVNPGEAVKNNVFGTKIVSEAADRHGTERFILISSDKAVNPTSVMGATKRAAELIIQALAKHNRTKFVAVRFGNVLGSRGSVVPLFKRQIARGGPLTVTHPEMSRYFMTIPEAVQLVIQAGSMGEGGEIFVLDMGEPVKIIDLATALIRLSGLEPNVDVPIQFVGIRPGEKLSEEVLTTEEGTLATRHKRIFVTGHSSGRETAVERMVESLGALATAKDSPSSSVIIEMVNNIATSQHSHDVSETTTVVAGRERSG